jgi:hypothetical protein
MTMSRYAPPWSGEGVMVKVVEVKEGNVQQRPPPSEPDYEIVAADPEADGYDITEIIKMLKDRSQAVEFEAESPQE